MIKISQIKKENGSVIPMQEFAEEFYDKINSKFENGKGDKKKESLIERIRSEIRRIRSEINGSSKLAEFYEFILDEANDFKMLKEIIISPPAQLETVIAPKIESKRQELSFNWSDRTGSIENRKDVLNTFGYKSFRNKYGAWLLNHIGIKSCPYCNSQSILVTDSKSGKRALCDLDHFFSKNNYPYFSLSFYNLIPICASCNRIKANKPTSIQSWYHPYEDDLNTLFNFSTDAQSVIDMIINKNKVKIKILKNTGLSSEQSDKVDTLQKTFHIEEIYDNHSDVAEELYWKSQYYNQSRKAELLALFEKNLCLSKEELNRMILGNYVLDEDLLRRPLAKLMKDIGKEIGLI